MREVVLSLVSYKCPNRLYFTKCLENYYFKLKKNKLKKKIIKKKHYCAKKLAALGRRNEELDA